MELLGDVLGRVLAGVRAKMDEGKAGASVEARTGKEAPGGGGAGVKSDRLSPRVTVRRGGNRLEINAGRSLRR